jgi:hypothetical protein
MFDEFSCRERNALERAYFWLLGRWRLRKGLPPPSRTPRVCFPPGSEHLAATEWREKERKRIALRKHPWGDSLGGWMELPIAVAVFLLVVGGSFLIGYLLSR